MVLLTVLLKCLYGVVFCSPPAPPVYKGLYVNDPMISNIEYSNIEYNNIEYNRDSREFLKTHLKTQDTNNLIRYNSHVITHTF